MATKFYKGNKPLLSQPSIGGGKMGRVYIGGQLTYGAAPVGLSYIPTLDTYTGASHAYSLRLLRTDYTGNSIQIKRDSDSTTQDIGFAADGSVDSAAITSFVGSNSATVTTWYDQSGNADDFVFSNEPTIVSSGTIQSFSNGVTALVPSTTSGVNTDATVASGEHTMFGVAKRIAGGSSTMLQHSSVTLGANTSNVSISYSGTVTDVANDDEYVFGAYVMNTDRWRKGIGNQGGLPNTGLVSSQVPSGTITMFNSSTSPLLFGEYIAYNSNYQSNLVAIQDSINEYWSLY